MRAISWVTLCVWKDADVCCFPLPLSVHSRPLLSACLFCLPLIFPKGGRFYQLTGSIKKGKKLRVVIIREFYPEYLIAWSGFPSSRTLYLQQPKQ